MWQFIANLILRNRLIIIGLLTLLTVFLGYNAITGLKLDNRYGVLLPETAQASIDYERFQEMFGEDGGVLVIGIQTDSLYTEDRFRNVKQKCLDSFVSKTTHEIADTLFISSKTVEAHKSNLIIKTGVKNTAGLVIYAVQNQLIDADKIIS